MPKDTNVGIAGIMADFTVTAVRTTEDTYSVKLLIGDANIVARADDLPLTDKTYESCFDAVKGILNGRLSAR